MLKIASILPKAEGFSPQNFGAVALCVRDFTLNSRFKGETAVLGGVDLPGFEGVRYAAMPPGKWYQNRTRAYVGQCARYIHTYNIALAEVHNRPHILLLLARQVTCRLALHLHNDPQEMEGAHSAPERQKLIALCDAVYCVSNYIRERFLEGVDTQAARKVHVVYNGLAIPASLPTKEKLITFAGRMTEGKGGMLLAQALRIALPQLPDWEAVLIGSRRHEVAKKLTPHEQEIASILQVLGDKVQMPGFLSHEETLGYFARSHIAVVPSLWQEPFGRTALEAMAYGCALISSGTGGLKEVTQEAALTLPKLNAQALADAIIMLAQDDIRRTLLQQDAQQRATYFSIAECTKLLDKVRQEILAEKKL